ncbi:hypothetical protein LH51_00590 [Nitrincola sp. A-D6]|nr:hypothetical protein LH51_00590 [Nitrincola sp. A-D6]
MPGQKLTELMRGSLGEHSLQIGEVNNLIGSCISCCCLIFDQLLCYTLIMTADEISRFEPLK